MEGLFDFRICVYEQSISHLLLYFSISMKVFGIFYNEMEILESLFVIQSKITCQEYWEFLTNVNEY